MQSHIVIVAMKTVLVRLPWLSHPPMTIMVLDDSCTAVQEARGSGRSPVVILTPGVGEGEENDDGWEGSFGIVTSHG